MCVRLDVALDLEILATESYSGDYFLQEIKGLAYSSGVDYKVTIMPTPNGSAWPELVLCNVHPIPENSAYPYDWRIDQGLLFNVWGRLQCNT